MISATCRAGRMPSHARLCASPGSKWALIDAVAAVMHAALGSLAAYLVGGGADLEV